MTLSLADRSNKAQKVKVLPIAGKDPDAQRSEMIKVALCYSDFDFNYSWWIKLCICVYVTEQYKFGTG